MDYNYQIGKTRTCGCSLILVENGWKSRNLPHDFQLYTTVSDFYHAVVKSGLWEKLLAALVAQTREQAEKKAQLTYGIVESQRVKTTGSSQECGIDGEKTKAAKKHIVPDTMSNLLGVVVHAANIHDTKAGILAEKRAVEKYPFIQRFCADAGYRKGFEQDVKDTLRLEANISARIKPECTAFPKQWIVERTFAWINNSRRLSKDYEITTNRLRLCARLPYYEHVLLAFALIGTDCEVFVWI